jgi:hypothetical protein
MQSIIFLGPDRVGKTTTIHRTSQRLLQVGYGVQKLHFSEIKPEHHSPVDQFRNALTNIESPGPDFLLIDRFVPDTLFYESVRRQMPSINPACAQEPESLLLEVSRRVDVVILKMGWTQELIDRHIWELRNTYPGASTYWINAQLELRMNEHNGYYEHVKEFFNSNSLILPTNVHTIPSVDGIDLFTLCPAIPLPDR